MELLPLRELPKLRLSSLQLKRLGLQLLPVEGFCGVLGGAVGRTDLTRLELDSCSVEYCSLPSYSSVVRDEIREWEAALPQLPGLVHFSLDNTGFSDTVPFVFPTGVLREMQQLTFLELAAVQLEGPQHGEPALQPLQALTRLADLRVVASGGICLGSSMLSGTAFLTRLHLLCCSIEPGVSQPCWSLTCFPSCCRVLSMISKSWRCQYMASTMSALATAACKCEIHRRHCGCMQLAMTCQES